MSQANSQSKTTAQPIDLFDFARTPALPVTAPKDAPAPLTQPSDEAPRLPVPLRVPAWEKLLEGRRYAQPPHVTVLVSTLWTGVILETFSDPDLGRRMLDQNGVISDLPPDSAYGRIVHASCVTAQKWHRARALRVAGLPGASCIRFTFEDYEGRGPLPFPAPFVPSKQP